MHETISTDVLIIGGGGAGLRAAVEARDHGASVTMVVKGKYGNSGCTLNVGTSAVVGLNGQNGDTNMSSMCDLVSFGGFLADQKLAKDPGGRDDGPCPGTHRMGGRLPARG